MVTFSAVVLAAGQAKRMRSSLPKVLHPLAGRPMVYYPVQAALAAGAKEAIVVVPALHEGAIRSSLQAQFGPDRIQTVVQEVPRGTGDAAQVALSRVSTGRVLILCGDTPLVVSADLEPLGRALADDATTDLALLSCRLKDPAGYGRVLRDGAGNVTEIREHRDLRTDEERLIDEVNAGIYLANRDPLETALLELKPTNVQGEYYLTDIVATLARSGAVRAVVGSPEALLGVNDQVQLREVDALLGRRIIERHARTGVALRGQPRIDDTVEIEPEAVIEDGVHLRGCTRVGRGATIDAGCVVTDSVIEPKATLRPYSVVAGSRVASGAQIGPFAHLRPGTDIQEGTHAANMRERLRTRDG